MHTSHGVAVREVNLYLVDLYPLPTNNNSTWCLVYRYRCDLGVAALWALVTFSYKYFFAFFVFTSRTETPIIVIPNYGPIITIIVIPAPNYVGCGLYHARAVPRRSAWDVSITPAVSCCELGGRYWVRCTSPSSRSYWVRWTSWVIDNQFYTLPVRAFITVSWPSILFDGPPLPRQAYTYDPSNCLWNHDTWYPVVFSIGVSLTVIYWYHSRGKCAVNLHLRLLVTVKTFCFGRQHPDCTSSSLAKTRKGATLRGFFHFFQLMPRVWEIWVGLGWPVSCSAVARELRVGRRRNECRTTGVLPSRPFFCSLSRDVMFLQQDDDRVRCT